MLKVQRVDAGTLVQERLLAMHLTGGHQTFPRGVPAKQSSYSFTAQAQIQFCVGGSNVSRPGGPPENKVPSLHVHLTPLCNDNHNDKYPTTVTIDPPGYTPVRKMDLLPALKE